MEFEYTLETDDLLAFGRHHIAHSPTLRRVHRTQIVTITTAIVVGPMVLSVVLPNFGTLVQTISGD